MKNKSEKPFQLLINTHHHSDHTAGNISYKGIVDHVLSPHESRKPTSKMLQSKIILRANNFFQTKLILMREFE